MFSHKVNIGKKCKGYLENSLNKQCLIAALLHASHKSEYRFLEHYEVRQISIKQFSQEGYHRQQTKVN